MNHKFKTYRGNAEKGFTLVELLIALVVIVVLAGISLTYFNTSGSKGKALFAMMSETADAAEIFRADVSCYPLTTGVLLQDPGKANKTASWCPNLSVGANWKGPYIKPNPLVNGNIVLGNISPNLTLHVARCVGTNCRQSGPTGAAVKVNTNGIGAGGPMSANNTYWMLVANNVPKDIAIAAVTSCNGNESITKNSTKGVIEKCGMEASGPELGQVALLYAQGRGTLGR